jgi:succinate dehydrogenase / fumarate reductase, cytochrome b subunit
METKVLTHRRYQPKSYVIGALLTLWSSSIGKKAVMSLTGIAMMSFVLMHTYGTLKIFKGEQAFNDYAVWLREVGSPLLSHGMALWITRIGLLGAVSLHMLAAWLVTRRSWAARPTRYQEVEPLQSTFASRTIRWGGVVIALFVVYHILHFTFGAVGYGAGQYSSTSVYRNVVVGFSVWYVSAFYIVAQLFLGLHWYHGGWSILHTLGVATAWGDRVYALVGGLIALGVTLGNISVPVAVLTGLVK